MKAVLIALGIVVLSLALPSDARVRQLHQQTPEVGQPAGLGVLFKWRGIGTQNYTSAEDSSYQPAGAVADLYIRNTTRLIAKHYFRAPGEPTFVQIDADGNEKGSVTASSSDPRGSGEVAPREDDGGFGSIPELLLTVIDASGSLANVNYIQRLNTLGGVVPDDMFTLPANNGTANFLLAVPYQADYIFLVPEALAPPAAPAVTPDTAGK